MGYGRKGNFLKFAQKLAKTVFGDGDYDSFVGFGSRFFFAQFFLAQLIFFKILFGEKFFLRKKRD